MKTIQVLKIEIPWYIEPFTLISYNESKARIGFSVPFKHMFQVVWWAFPKWLFDYQQSDCINYIPDYVLPSDGRQASGTKVKSFLGLVIRNEQGGLYAWKWWNYLERK